MKEQGFKTILDKKSYSSIEKAYERILEIGEERGNLYFDIDGAVIKVNELTAREMLGDTAKFLVGLLHINIPPRNSKRL